MVVCVALRAVMECARPTGGAPSANVCRKGHKISCERGHETFMMRQGRLGSALSVAPISIDRLHMPVIWGYQLSVCVCAS